MQEETHAIIERFWEMIIVDAIIGNRDRHEGNWGYLVKLENTPYGWHKIHTPACMFKEENDAEAKARAEAKGKKDTDTHRTNYYQKFEEFRATEPSKSIIDKFLRRVDFNMILQIIYMIVEPIDIEDVYKYFYCKIVCLRYLCILCRVPFDDAYSYVEQIDYLSSRRLQGNV